MIRASQLKILRFLIAIIGLAFCLRLYHTGQTGLNLDELKFLYAIDSFNFKSIFLYSAPPLSQLIESFFIHVFELSEFGTRIPSVLFSTLTAASISKIAYDKFGLRGSLLATFLYAILPLSIVISQQSLAYSIFEFFALWQIYAFNQYRKAKLSRPNFLLISLLAVLAGQSAILIFIAEILYVFILKKKYFYLFWISVLICSGLLIGSNWLYSYFATLPFFQFPSAEFSFLPITPLVGLFFSNFISAAGVILMLMCWSFKVSTPEVEKYLPFALLMTIITAVLISFAYGTHLAIFSAAGFEFLTPFFVIALAGVMDQAMMKVKSKSFAIALVSLIAIATGSFIEIKAAFTTEAPASWREASFTVSQLPSSLVLSKQSPWIEKPYFSRFHTPVKRLEDMEQLALDLPKYFNNYINLWIVEDPETYSKYKNQLEELLRHQNLALTNHSFAQKEKTNLIVLQLTRK